MPTFYAATRARTEAIMRAAVAGASSERVQQESAQTIAMKRRDVYELMMMLLRYAH